MRWVKIAAGCALAVLAITGCSAANASSAAPSIAIPSAYINLPTGDTTYGYLDIRDNGAADELLSVTTSVGGKVSFIAPEHLDVQPVIMHKISEIPIAADAVTAGHDITLTLTFARGGKITILALVTNPETGGSSYFLN
jgi:copper(I)-binding protein